MEVVRWMCCSHCLPLISPVVHLSRTAHFQLLAFSHAAKADVATMLSPATSRTNLAARGGMIVQFDCVHVWLNTNYGKPQTWLEFDLGLEWTVAMRMTHFSSASSMSSSSRGLCRPKKGGCLADEESATTRLCHAHDLLSGGWGRTGPRPCARCFYPK